MTTLDRPQESERGFGAALAFLCTAPYIVWVVLLVRDIWLGGREPAAAYYFLAVVFAVGAQVVIVRLRATGSAGFRAFAILNYVTFAIAALLAAWMLIVVATRPSLAQLRAQDAERAKQAEQQRAP